MPAKHRIINIENEVIFGRVYKIYNIIDEKVYIGSTTKPLVKRLGDHMYDYKIGTNMKLYTHFKNIGVEKFNMRLLEGKIVENIGELRQLEQKWINKENPENLLNSKNAMNKCQSVEIVKPIIEELIDKIFEIKLDSINGNQKEKN